MNWYKKAQNDIIIYLDKYKTSLWEELWNTVRLSAERYDRISNLTYKENELKNLFNQINYPYSESILQNLNSITIKDINKLFQWYLSLNYTEKTIQIRSVIKRIEDILTHIQANGNLINNWTEKEAIGYMEELLKQTMNNMMKIKKLITSKIDIIKNWQGSAIVIEAIEYCKDNDIAPADSAYVYVGGLHGPMFSLFVTNNGIIVDDIMDGAENIEEFGNMTKKSDYFALINVLQNITNEKKDLVLYTARPVKDRDFYLTKQIIPENIYLTTSLDRVQGIAMELKGEDQYRDIWKVKISSEYLVISYDGGNFKDYMTIRGTSPTKWMKLLYPGE